MGRGTVLGRKKEEEVQDLGCWIEARLRGVPCSYDARYL